MNAKQCKQLRRMARALASADTAAEIGVDSSRALYRQFKRGYKRLQSKEAAAVQLLQRLHAAKDSNHD